jgi:hypothetical protein
LPDACRKNAENSSVTERIDFKLIEVLKSQHTYHAQMDINGCIFMWDLKCIIGTEFESSRFCASRGTTRRRTQMALGFQHTQHIQHHFPPSHTITLHLLSPLTITHNLSTSIFHLIFNTVSEHRGIKIHNATEQERTLSNNIQQTQQT